MYKSNRMVKKACKNMVVSLLATSFFVSFQTNFVFASPNEQSLTRLTGVVATSNSDWNANVASKTIDGNVSGESYSWVSNKNTSPYWLKIQLPSQKTISKYILHHSGVLGDKKYDPVSFKVSISTDDVNWTEVDQVDNNIYDVTGRTFATPVTARYVKVEYVTPEQNFNQSAASMRARLAEIELFSSADAVSQLYQRVPVITLNDRTVPYTGDPVNWYVDGATTPIAYTGGTNQIPFKYKYKRHGVTENFTETAPSQLGSYDVKAVFEGNSIYSASESNVALLTVTKANISLSLESGSFNHTGSGIAMTGAKSLPFKVPYSYKYKALTPGAVWVNTAPKEVGTYMVKAVFPGNDVALPAESNETTMSILQASTKTNWTELRDLLSGLTAKQQTEVSDFYLRDKYMESGMLMGNGTFGVVSDARRNEQSYFLTSGDAWKNPARDQQQALVNAQLKLTNGDPIVSVPNAASKFIYTSTIEADRENIFNGEDVNAFDSNENTEWISTSQKVSQENKPRNLEKWVSLKGKQPFTFNKIEIKHHSVRFPDEAKYNLYNYNIQTSNDGNSWTTIKSVTGNMYSSNTFNFDNPITSSYLRVTTTKPVDPRYETLHFPKDMTSARITDINLYNNGVNVVNPPTTNDGSFLHERDILNAEIRSKMKYNSNLVSYQTWVADDQNSMFTNVTLDSSAAGPQKVNIQLNAPVISGITNTTGIDGNVVWLTRNGETGFIFRGATATKVIKGNYVMGANMIVLTLNPGETAKIATALYTHSGLKSKAGEGSILVTKDMTTVKNIAVQRLNAMTEASIQTSYTHHQNWWKNYWLKSYVNFSDPVMEDFYYNMLYILGCAIRQTPEWAEQPNVVGGLNGIFHTNDNTAATGNAILNYNYEAPFYGLYSSNRMDMSQPYYADAVNALSYWQNETAKNGYQGVQIDRGVTPLRAFYGVMAPQAPAVTKNPGLSSDQKSNIALFTRPFIWDWQYTRNKENLKRFVYPWIKEVARFYCDFVVVGSDGKYWIEDSSEHEAGDDTNTAIDMGYFRSTLRDYIEMAQHLNVDADLVARSQHVLNNLAPIPTSMNNPTTKSELASLGFDNNKEVIVSGVKSENDKQKEQFDLPWAQYISSTNQPTLLEGVVHPGEFVSMGSDPALIQIAKNTFEYLDPMTPHTDGGALNGFPKTFTIAARLGIDPDKLMERFLLTLKTMHNSKMFYDTTASYENTGALESVNSMLLQNELNNLSGGTYEMRLFPSWSKKYDAKFVTLRAKNAFRVSSELKNGKVLSTEIISDAGNPVTLVSPWAKGIVVTDKNGNQVAVTKGKTRHTNEVTYTFSTAVNGVYTVTEATAH